MTISSAPSGSSILLVQLVAAAVRATVLAAAAGLLLSLFRVKAVCMRLFAWTAVLYAGLSMPVLAWLLYPMPVAIPFPPLNAPAKLVSANVGTSASVRLPNPEQLVDQKAAARPGRAKLAFWLDPHTQVVRASSRISSVTSLPWTPFAATAYLAITVFLLFRLIAGVRLAHQLVRSSNPIHEPKVLLRLSSGGHASRWRIVPRIHESALVSVPVTTGAIAPTIMLPLDWKEWDDTKLDAVITHEMSHVVRRDPFAQYVSLMYRAIFWFSPLAWWLNRHISELAEEASDEAALAAGAERTCYARTLLEFFQAVKNGPGRIQWQGVSIATADQAGKRLEKILAWRGSDSLRLKRLGFAIIVLLAMPAIYVASAARPVSHGQSSQDPTSSRGPISQPSAGTSTEPRPPRSTPATPSLPTPPPEGDVSNSGPGLAQPASPAAPRTAASPVSSGIDQDQNSGDVYGQGSSDSYQSEDELRFAIVSGKSDAFTISGSREDARQVEKLRKQIPGDFIWFQRDEKSFIIRDQATIDRARQLWAPQEELGRRQAELGKQQEALGKQQQELGSRMERVRVKVPDISAELDKVKAELHELGPDASVEQIGRMQTRIGELQAKMGEVQAHAGDEQGKLGAEMGALGEQQGKLGQQQGELGREQAQLARKATRAMQELLDDAIKKGIAQPEPEPPATL